MGLRYCCPTRRTRIKDSQIRRLSILKNQSRLKSKANMTGMSQRAIFWAAIKNLLSSETWSTTIRWSMMRELSRTSSMAEFNLILMVIRAETEWTSKKRCASNMVAIETNNSTTQAESSLVLTVLTRTCRPPIVMLHSQTISHSRWSSNTIPSSRMRSNETTLNHLYFQPTVKAAIQR